MMAAGVAPEPRFETLDGWRGVSIVCVLAAHLLPLGPSAWGINASAGTLGMALFFTLSGFLITRFLLGQANVAEFLLRRIFRIVPLAWLVMAVALAAMQAVEDRWAPHFLFFANLPPFWLTSPTAHLWSLCVEMQFYGGIALLVALLGRRGLLLLPVICVVITASRIHAAEPASIVTWFRVDEILAGCTLALSVDGRLGAWLRTLPTRLNPYLLLGLLLVSSHPDAGYSQYARPYLAAALVGATLADRAGWLMQALRASPLTYLATVSFALYVLHPLFAATWLGDGEGVEKYLKRPLLLIAVFAFAHLSTFYFERRWMAFGKQLAMRVRPLLVGRSC